MKKTLFLILTILFSNLTIAQIIVMDVVQVKEGMSSEYEKIEEFVAPIMGEAVNNGDKMGWYIFKLIKGGDLSEIENKGIGDYVIINVYKDKDQMKSNVPYSDYANKVYKGKMSRKNIQKKMDNLMKVRKDTRTYILENIYYTKPNSLQIGDVVTVFPAEQLNEDYENFEMYHYLPMWEEMILTGAHKAWNFNRIIDRSENAYKNITHIIFNVKGTGDYKFKTDFISTKLNEIGSASRKGYNTADIQLIQMKQ